MPAPLCVCHSDDHSKAATIIGKVGRPLPAIEMLVVDRPSPQLAELEATGVSNRTILVAWSARAASSRVLVDIASRACESDSLLLMLFDDSPLPFGLGQAPQFQFSRWRGGRRNPVLRDLAAHLSSTAGAAASRPARRRWIVFSVSLTSIVGVSFSLIGFNVLSVQDQVCAAVPPQPWLSDSCASYGLGHRPLRADRLDWAKVRSGSCEDLTDYVRAHANGYYRDMALGLLKVPEERQSGLTEARKHGFTMPIERDDSSAATRAAALAATLRRADSRARIYCRNYAGAFGLEAAHATARLTESQCANDIGWACSATVQVTCSIDVPITVKVCPGKPVS